MRCHFVSFSEHQNTLDHFISLISTFVCTSSHVYMLVLWLGLFYIQVSSSVVVSSYIYTSSSCRATSTNLPDPLSPLFPIIHPVSAIELWFIGSSWSTCLYSSLWRGPQEYVAYEFVPISPAGSRMSGSSYLDCLHDGW